MNKFLFLDFVWMKFGLNFNSFRYDCCKIRLELEIILDSLLFQSLNQTLFFVRLEVNSADSYKEPKRRKKEMNLPVRVAISIKYLGLASQA